MNLPKGILNIITDYSHTLFYIQELKDKTNDIYYRTILYSGDLCYILGSFTIFKGIYPDNLRFKLLNKENERKSIFGIKKEKLLWTDSSEYSRNYLCY